MASVRQVGRHLVELLGRYFLLAGRERFPAGEEDSFCDVSRGGSWGLNVVAKHTAAAATLDVCFPLPCRSLPLAASLA